MKKILLIGTVAAVLSSLTSYGQGYFNFTSGTRAVWDNWSSVSTGVPKADASNNVAFLINWNGTAAPLVGTAVETKIATNRTSAVDGVAAWNSILNDPNFHFGTNQNTGLIAIVQTTTAGAFNFNGGATFPVIGTSAAGGTIDIFAIAWSAVYANPFLAAAANAPVGWSHEFNYSYGNIAGTPTSFSVQGGANFPFGVAPVPEPTTLALAGLGAASLLIFRKRKQ